MKHSPLMRPRLVSTSILLFLIAGMVYSVRPTITAQVNPQNIPDERVPDEKDTAKSKGGIVHENNQIDSSKLQSVTGYFIKYQSLEFLFSPVMTPESGKRFTKFGESASSKYVDVVEDPNSPEGFIYKQSSDRIQFGKILQNRTAAQFVLKGEGNYKTGGDGGGGKPPHWSSDVDSNCDLQFATVFSRRTSNPEEDFHKAREKFRANYETKSKFKWELKNIFGGPIRWVLKPYGENPVAKGSGRSVSHSFLKGFVKKHNQDNVHLIFYCDSNKNGEYDSSSEEDFLYQIDVMDKRKEPLLVQASWGFVKDKSVDWSVIKSNITTAIQKASNDLIRKDSDQDVRARIEFNPELRQFRAQDNAECDECTTYEQAALHLWLAPGDWDIRVVSDLPPGFLGVYANGRILIRGIEHANPSTYSHELGHDANLNHVSDTDNVMCCPPEMEDLGDDELKPAQATSFEIEDF